MPAIDYYAIKSALAEIIAADEDINGRAEVSVSAKYNPDILTPSINIEMMNRTLAPNQSVSAGTRTRYAVQMAVIVMCGSQEHGVSEQLRDELVSRIETILMSNRQLGGLVDTLVLTGGELVSGYSNESGYYVSGGEILFTVDASVTI